MNNQTIQTDNGTLMALAQLCYSILKSRDLATYRHSENVRKIAIRILDALGIKGEMKEIVDMGCMLHDLGKISLPGALLWKTSAFSSEEREYVKNHSAMGHTILKDAEDYLPIQILEIVLHHHEKNGGKGYPTGLNAMPFHVEVVSVADMAAAMQEDRIYRSGLTRNESLDEILKYQWDDRLVELIHNSPGIFELQEGEKKIVV